MLPLLLFLLLLLVLLMLLRQINRPIDFKEVTLDATTQQPVASIAKTSQLDAVESMKWGWLVRLPLDASQRGTCTDLFLPDIFEMIFPIWHFLSLSYYFAFSLYSRKWQQGLNPQPSDLVASTATT